MSLINGFSYENIDFLLGLSCGAFSFLYGRAYFVHEREVLPLKFGEGYDE